MAVISVLGPYICPFSVSNTLVFSSNAVTVEKKKNPIFYLMLNFLRACLDFQFSVYSSTNLWVCVFLWPHSIKCHDLLKAPLTLPGIHPNTSHITSMQIGKLTVYQSITTIITFTVF